MDVGAQRETAIEKGFDPMSLYNPNLNDVGEPVRTYLEEQGNIPAEQILAHVKKLRDRAFAVFPYACVGQFSFLELSIAASPCYPEMLDRVKHGEKLLDLGCAFGQELRQLLYDGAPGENLYGSDLQQAFLDLGHELFLDESKLPKSQLISGDILDPKCRLLIEMKGELDIIYISLFIHVFDWEQQITVAKHMLQLLAKKPGSMIVGRVMATRNQEALTATKARMPYYFHDMASWQHLWDQVEMETHIKLSVNAWEQPDAMAKKHPLPGVYVLGSMIRLE